MKAIDQAVSPLHHLQMLGSQPVTRQYAMPNKSDNPDDAGISSCTCSQVMRSDVCITETES